jgi:hypothetical protein
MWISIATSFLTNLIVGLYKSWQAEQDARQVGAYQQATATETQAKVKVDEAIKASDAVKPIAADELLNHTPANDPDFRD